MRIRSTRCWLGCFAALAGAALAVGACTGTPVGVVDDDGGGGDGGIEAAAEGGVEGGNADAPSETSVDATVDGGSDGSSGNDASSDGTVPMSDASADASDGGTTETGAGDASEAGSDAGVDAPTESGTTQEASTDAPAADAESDASNDAEVEAAADAAPEAATDGAADAPLEAAACTFGGTWSMTVQTVTAVPSFCQGVMDCTNCGFTFNATATQPTPTTIDWNVDPGGTLCTAFSGSITPAGQFTTTETNCSPAGNGSTFDGQIDLPTCSMSATYVYMLSNCTITETMTGTQ